MMLLTNRLDFSNVLHWGPTYPRPKGGKVSELLTTPEGREEYREWQRREYEVIATLRTIVGKFPAKNCYTCKGKGVVPLLTNMTPCPTCEPRDPEIPAGIKPGDVFELIKTAAGRRRLYEMKIAEQRDD